MARTRTTSMGLLVNGSLGAASLDKDTLLQRDMKQVKMITVLTRYRPIVLELI